MMFNDIFMHKGEVWAKVKCACKLPILGFVNSDMPIRMTEENFKVLLKRGYPVIKIPVSELYVTPIGRYYNPAPLAHQKVEEFRIDKVEKITVKDKPVENIIIEEKLIEPTIESVIPANCVPDISSVGDMLNNQLLEDENIEEENDDEPVTRHEINTMKKADLQKLLDYLEIEYTDDMVVKDLRELALTALEL